MLVETLRADWAARGTSVRVSALPEFANGALILGAGTKLAEARGERRDEAAESERAVALVSVAIGRPLDASAATHVRRSLAKAREGDAPLALTHLALAGVGRLDDPREDSRRPFIADGLMKADVPPSTILAALSDAPPDALDRAYNPDQPRVPAGNGRPSGRWTNGDWTDDTVEADDTATPTGARNAGASSEAQGVQIADASDDWIEHLNPVHSAAAAESGKAPFNGAAPNAQHQAGVRQAIALYQAHGFVIASDGPTYVNVPGFDTPRVYDFVVFDPIAGVYIGVAVKTTMYDTIRFNESQVEKDVAIYESPEGGFAPALTAHITEVAYETFCVYCAMINLAKADLSLQLLAAGIRVRSYQYPGGSFD